MTTHTSEKQILLREINQDNDAGLFKFVAGWITKRSKEKLVLKGTPGQVETAQEAIKSTKEFHEALQREESDLSSISEKLQKKHECASNFEKTFGLSWIL